MKKTSAVVIFTDVFDINTVVIQHRLIHIQDGSIGAQHMDIGRNGADHEAQITLARPQSLFRLLAIINVRDEYIPVEDSPLAVAHGDPAVLKPAIHAIEPTDAMLDIKWLARRDRVARNFDTVSKILRVNDVVRLPLLCLLCRFAEILQKWSIEDLWRAIRRKVGKKARHIVQ